MTPALQNRLVGTIILVALAVIFLPDILDGKKQSSQDVFVDLPKRPETKVVRKVAPFPEREVERLTAAKVEEVNEPIVDEPEPLAAKVVEPEVTQSTENTPSQRSKAEPSESQMLSAGWVVQLGVFRHEKNVRELLDKLQKAGYRAFSRKIETSSGQLTKVFVGPDLQKEKLESALEHLYDVTNLKGRITPFTVN